MQLLRPGADGQSVACQLLFVLRLRSPSPTLFPYTTLFRSRSRCPTRSPARQSHRSRSRRCPRCPRSEEHTSELQSHSDLVCRLLLEKNKPAQSSRPVGDDSSAAGLSACPPALARIDFASPL